MNDVTELLPHRAPFLFLDEIVDSTQDTLHARRTVRADEPHFAGHYPGDPIMPGVLLCEAALQAGCALMVLRGGDKPQGTPVVTRMNDVKFRRIVRPGDVLDIEVTHQRDVMGVSFMRGLIKVGGKRTATLEFAVTMTEGA